jgi:REP element-mobilizing transposase RayT
MRLVESVYRQPGQTFSVTIGTEPRSPVFADIGLGLECVDLLKDICVDAGARGYAYCLMPDHVHLLIGVGNRKGLSTIVGGWKSLCYRTRRRRGRGESFWQRSFYDHALRREEDLRLVARYILENPVRAGLVRDPRDFPLSGSFEFDVK